MVRISADQPASRAQRARWALLSDQPLSACTAMDRTLGRNYSTYAAKLRPCGKAINGVPPLASSLLRRTHLSADSENRASAPGPLKLHGAAGIQSCGLALPHQHWRKSWPMGGSGGAPQGHTSGVEIPAPAASPAPKTTMNCSEAAWLGWPAATLGSKPLWR